MEILLIEGLDLQNTQLTWSKMYHVFGICFFRNSQIATYYGELPGQIAPFDIEYQKNTILIITSIRGHVSNVYIKQNTN